MCIDPASLTRIQTFLHRDQWSVDGGEERGRRKGRLVAKQGIQTPASILIKQICHKSFYKCPVGGYRGWWKYPIHAVSSPAGLKPRLLARLSVLTASDPLAICRVGCPVPRALCVLTLRRFNTEAEQKKKEEGGKKKSFHLVILVLVHSQHRAQLELKSDCGWQRPRYALSGAQLWLRGCLTRLHKQTRRCGRC